MHTTNVNVSPVLLKSRRTIINGVVFESNDGPTFVDSLTYISEGGPVIYDGSMVEAIQVACELIGETLAEADEAGVDTAPAFDGLATLARGVNRIRLS